MSKTDKGKISRKNWSLIWILGLAGQLCWNVENAWFNSFVYEKIAPNPTIISWMVGVSAVVATFATFLIGTLGDRMGKRKPFVALGYIMWGICTMIFGVGEFLPTNSIFVAASFVVLMDAIMSFFGSVGYDSAFSAWTTDISDESNRGQIGGAFATMPVLATIFGSIVSGVVIELIDFFAFFIIIGLVVSLIGIYSLFALEDAPTLKAKKDTKGFWHQFFSVFRYKTVQDNQELFWVFIVMMIYFIGFNVYFPYINIYFVNYLKMDYAMSGIIQGISLLLAVMMTIPTAKYINQGKNIKVITGALLINALGLFIIAWSSHILFLGIGMLFTGMGYVLILQALTAWFKNLYPEEQRGQFEGIKQIFFVCIPMIIGPAISNVIIRNFGVKVVIDGVEGIVPNELLLLISGIITLLTLLPLIRAGKIHEQRKEILN